MTDHPQHCQAGARNDRCDFTGTPDELEAHAADTGHKLCRTCHRSLRDTETGACQHCIDRVRDNLTAITRAHDQLPTIAYHNGYDSGAIPGGMPMVILAGGNIRSNGPADDPRFGDPIIAVAALAEWEWLWRTLRDEPTALDPTIARTTVYLRSRLFWAAEHFDDWAAFVAHVRELAGQDTHVAGLADDPVPAKAKCFECRGALLRVYRPPREDPRARLAQAKHRINASAKRRRKPASVKARRDMVVRAVSGRKHEGLTDILECAGCGKTYTWAQYAMNLRERAEQTTGWVSVKDAAEVARVTERDVRKWVDRMVVEVRCDVLTHRLEVWWPAVHERAAKLLEARRANRVA